MHSFILYIHKFLKISNKKIQKQWKYYFDGMSEPLFNESETWNIIAHINKRWSYGKALRYSDRFYRNWAIKIANQNDKITQNNLDLRKKNQTQNWDRQY